MSLSLPAALQSAFELTLLPFPSRSQELRSETADLRERIKHLNDMVFCQQRKVKAMIEEVRQRIPRTAPTFIVTFTVFMCDLCEEINAFSLQITRLLRNINY